MKEENRSRIYSLVVMFIFIFAFQQLTAQENGSVKILNELFEQVLKDYLTEEGRVEIQGEPASEYISIKSIDLNDDGEPEYIVEGLKPPLMGMLAGNTWIYKKGKESFFLIGDLGSFENVTPINSKHNGYLDIMVFITLNAGKTREHLLFVFNGSKYVLLK